MKNREVKKLYSLDEVRSILMECGARNAERLHFAYASLTRIKFDFFTFTFVKPLIDFGF